MLRKTLLALSCVSLLGGCDGLAFYRLSISPSDPSGQPPEPLVPAGSGVEEPAPVLVGVSGARRLTRYEYDSVLHDLLGDTSRPGTTGLPADASAPFDNGYREQQPSQTLIESVETLATQAAARLVADPVRRAALLPCTPSGPGDAACLRELIVSFGRRALRRPLTDAEVNRYLSLQAYAVEANDFFYAVKLVVSAMLQTPKFLYRIERGTPVETEPGVFRLDSFELASRLSFFLAGSTPPDWLLDLAQAGGLNTPGQVRAAAEQLLAEPRAAEQVQRFHAFWLGYYDLPHSLELNERFRAESAALVRKVVLEDKADHLDLFRASATYVDATLAAHYGLPAPAAAAGEWVSYGESERQGILSHGGFLSAGVKALDSSPTLRGQYVRERLFCQPLPPPPSTVNADDGPPAVASSPCKEARYRAISQNAGCAVCHARMDFIGLGLESFDREGRFRTHEDEEPSCVIGGEGEVVGVGKFQGVKGLSDLLVTSGVVQRCVVRQVFRFAMGREDEPADLGLVQKLDRQWVEHGRRLDRLLVDLVSDETFAHRREE
ncbi:MAG: DUF1592 domain-containing protein [Myxococcota bacterium]